MTELGRQHWLQDPRLAQLFAVLESAGGKARVAGGAVRNGLWGLPVSDIDVATTLVPDAVMVAVRQAGFAVHPTGIEHGTVTVVIDALAVEVTTLRADVKTDGRRAVVAYTRDWAIDARRRDFTFNALYCDLTGKIYDETGQGLTDSAARRVRFVGSPEQRIREDYLRILRYFRFESQYGAGDFDPDAVRACERLQDGLKELSTERVQVELLKILTGQQVIAVIALMIKTGILQQVLVVDANLEMLEKVAAIERHLNIRADSLRRLAVLTRDISALRLSKARQKRFSRVQKIIAITPDSALLEKQKLLYELGPDDFRDGVILAWAATASPTDDSNWAALSNLADNWPVPKFPLTGKDLVAVGIKPGEKMGATLKQLEQHWIASGFQATRADLLEKIPDDKK